MLIAFGKPAFSDFRLQQKLAQLQKISGAVQQITAHEIFFMLASSPLNEEDKTKIENLLQASFENREAEKGEGFIIIPRIGTISPWSSKAQDIFQHCGLDKINRIEHGIYYQITT